MTFKNKRKKRKSRVRSVISTILIFLFAIISSTVLVVEKRKYKPYDERIFYLVCAGSEKTIRLLEDKKELLKNLGGANVVFPYKGLSYLVVNVYLDQESAIEIKENLKIHFPDADILKIRLKRLSRKVIKTIKVIGGLEMFVKQIFTLSNEFQDLQMNYLSGKITEGTFMSEMVAKKINLEKLIQNIDKNSEFAQKAVAFGELMALQLTNFLSGLTIAKHRENYICNYFVGFYLNYVELFECLQENGKL